MSEPTNQTQSTENKEKTVKELLKIYNLSN